MSNTYIVTSNFFQNVHFAYSNFAGKYHMTVTWDISVMATPHAMLPFHPKISHAAAARTFLVHFLRVSLRVRLSDAAGKYLFSFLYRNIA